VRKEIKIKGYMAGICPILALIWLFDIIEN
jgi:hypothetical protein